MVDQSADETAIVALMLKVRRAVAERDFETLARCHLHAPYAARWNASRLEGIFVRQGWDKVGARLRESAEDLRVDPPGLHEDPPIENLTIRVSGDLAWAIFTRKYATVPHHRAGPDAAHHVRILERHEGEWKIAFVGFLDPGLGRPDESLIRLDADGGVIWTSATAAAALATEDDLVIRNGKLRIRDSRVNLKLQAAIRWAAALDRGVVPGHGALPIVLDAGEGLPARVWWIIADGGSIYFSFGEGQDFRRIDVAAVVYGLSPGQKLVAGHIVAGLSIGEIAGAMQISPNTVRTHLDRIFEKTGVRNQVALVRVLLSIVAPL